MDTRFLTGMKKTVLFMLFSMCLFSTAKAAETAQANVTDSETQQSPQITSPIIQSNVQIKTRPEILGLWGIEIPGNKSCVEFYNFRGNNEVVVNSAKEWSAGLFDYQPSPDNTLEKSPVLIMQIKYENNERDCSGNQVNQSGEISQYYVRWKSPNVINFCASEQEDKCFATLKRVLP